MRLLSVIHGPAFGGAHNQALRLSDPLRERGFETTVVLPTEAGAAAARLREGSVDTVTVPLHRLRATADPRVQARFAASFVPDVRRLARLARERDAAVIQVHGATNPHGAMAARRAGAAVHWQLFDTRAPMPLRRLAMPYVIRHADAMTTWGRKLARVHPGATRLGERLITVYPPVEVDRFAPDPEARAAARERLEAGPDELLVGSVGVLNPQKGHEHMIRTAALVLAREPRARFRILGASSPAHEEYERMLRELIGTLGLQRTVQLVDPGPDVPLLLQGLDLFAMSSVPRSEGMPTAILEAMACAKAVVTTDVGAVGELVDDGETGLIVDPDDPRVLADAISALLADPARDRRLGEAARARALERFSLGRLADLHAQALETALRHRAERRA